MNYYLLSPDVAGGLGPRTRMDTSSHPPVVAFLHFEVEGWGGDVLLESFPCFIIDPAAAAALGEAGLSGFDVADCEVSKAEGTDGVAADEVLAFRWLRPTGVPGRDDVAVDATASLVVSDRALEVLRRFPLERCDTEVWEEG